MLVAWFGYLLNCLLSLVAYEHVLASPTLKILELGQDPHLYALAQALDQLDIDVALEQSGAD